MLSQEIDYLRDLPLVTDSPLERLILSDMRRAGLVK